MRAAPAIAPEPTWQARVADQVVQHPLIDTRLSLESLQRARPMGPPAAVYLGLGLCARDALSVAVPLDVLGLLLPAEAIRIATGAEQLVVLIADRHALDNGFAPAEVEERAAALADTLARIRDRCGLRALTIVRASQMHQERAYCEALAAVRRAAGPLYHDYALRQLADGIYLERRHGGLLKVGWALRGADPDRRRDEIAFDDALREVHGDRIPFVYCKPGRALSDHAPRVPPYVVTRPEARICLQCGEDAAAKLASAEHRASPHTVDACRRHLRAMLYAYSRDVERLPRGSLEERVSALIDRLAPGRLAPGRLAPDGLAPDGLAPGSHAPGDTTGEASTAPVIALERDAS